MAIATTDEGEVRVVGDNPVLYLYGDDDAPTTSANLWRVRFSPAGPGCVLLLHGELTGGEPRVYADNIGLSRFLREEIVREGQPYKDHELPTVTASFTFTDAMPWYLSAVVEAAGERVELAWSGLSAPFAGHAAPEPALGERYGHYAIYVPAAQAQAALDGRVATGTIRPLVRDGRDLGSAFVALAESWQRYGSG